MRASAPPLVHAGNWLKVNSDRYAAPRPCLFLDRDGVLIEEKNYLANASDVALHDGAAETIAAARRLGWAVAVVTNQAGIGRGYFGWPDFYAVQSRIESLLSAQGAYIDIELACPFHEDGLPPYNRDDDWRKPHPGMLLEAARQLNLHLAGSLLVGDKISDLEAAANAGLKRAIHVRTGWGFAHRERVMKDLANRIDVLCFESIAEVACLVI